MTYTYLSDTLDDIEYRFQENVNPKFDIDYAIVIDQKAELEEKYKKAAAWDRLNEYLNGLPFSTETHDLKSRLQNYLDEYDEKNENESEDD